MLSSLIWQVWQSRTPGPQREGSLPCSVPKEHTFFRAEGSTWLLILGIFSIYLVINKYLLNINFVLIASPREYSEVWDTVPDSKTGPGNSITTDNPEAESIGGEWMGQPECYFKIDHNQCHNHLNIIRINSENLYASCNPKPMTVVVSIYEILM